MGTPMETRTRKLSYSLSARTITRLPPTLRRQTGPATEQFGKERRATNLYSGEEGFSNRVLAAGDYSPYTQACASDYG